MKKILQKVGVIGFAFTMAISLAVPSTTSAQTVSELQALIAQLQAQLNALTGGSITSYTYTRDLTLGSTGADVIALQTFLEAKGVLTIPAGVSKGYFGPLTKAALARYQASVGISPAVGYFGPITRANVNAASTTGGTSTGGTTTGTTLNGGESSLEDFDLKSEDDAEEGKMTHVATIEFDVEDGDIKVNRLDLSFVFTGDDSQADDEPWDAFDTITLKANGKEIAEEDVDDEDDWLRDDTPFVFRLSNLDYVVREGKKAEIEVYLTSANNVDGADSQDASWEIYVGDNGIRGIDGQSIQQYIGDDSDVVAFDIEELGEGEDITLKSSSSDIDSTTLLVDADDKSEWHEVFVFKLEADENDIDLEELVLNITTGTATYANVINDIYIEIDGDEADDFDVANTSATSTNVTFDLDKDYTVDADDTVEVVVFVQFKKQDGNYVDGEETIQVKTVSVRGEGADDVSDAATVSGDTHTLSTSVADVTGVTWTVTRAEDGSTGTIDLFFTLTAEEDDFIVLGSDIIDEITGTFATSTGVATNSGFGTLTRVSGDSVTAVTGGFRVNEGDTTRFRVRFISETAGSNEVSIENIAGNEIEDSKQLSPTLILN